MSRAATRGLLAKNGKPGWQMGGGLSPILLGGGG